MTESDEPTPDWSACPCPRRTLGGPERPATEGWYRGDSARPRQSDYTGATVEDR